MKPSPQLEAQGLVAYEQARAFENLQRRRLPLMYGAFTLLVLLCSGLMLKMGRPVEATFCLLLGIGFPVLAWLQWQRSRLRYADNLSLLAKLENEYGEDLPWLQVERHFAALEKLERELEQEKGAIGKERG